MRKSDGTPMGTQAWSTVKIGGLGFITGGAIASDGSLMVCRTDVGGGYIRAAGVETWSQIIDPSRMTIPDALTSPSNDVGIYELDIAPSSASTILVVFRGRMLRSTNGGATFVDDSLNGTTGLFTDANSGQCRVTQHKLKFDPTNANVAYLGTQHDGLWRRLSAGWANIATVPVSTDTDDPGHRTIIIAIDNTSATTGSAPDVRRSVVYCSVNGNGFYKSTDGGGTFTLVSGHPGAGAGYRSTHLIVDQTGKIWLCLENGVSNNVYTSTNGGTTWTQITNTGSSNVGQIEVDPKDSTRIVGLCGAGDPLTSTNGGTTFSTPYFPVNNWAMPTGCPIAATELQFQLQTASAGASNILPHPTLAKDYVWGGYGVYFTTSPWPGIGPKALIRYEDTKGIEELVTYHIDIHPDGTTFLSCGDRGLVVQDKTGKYATNNWPNGSLSDGCNVDWAIDNSNYLVNRNHRGTDFSGFSTDKGNSWTAFPVSPSTGTGGHIAISNTNQIVSFPCQNAWPKFTHDAGNTWSDCVFSGFTRIADGTENGWGFGSPFGYRRHIVCADKNNAGTFYTYNYGPGTDPTQKGVWKSTDGGANWSKVGDPGTNNFGWHVGLFITPNGHLFINTGPLSNTRTEDVGLTSFRSEDGGVTWTALASINEVNCLAWGAPKAGSAIPYALYALGWLSGIFGLYRSDDKGATWVTQTVSPNSNFDWPQCMAADPITFGRVVVGYSGSGYQEGLYNFKMTVS